MVSLPIWAFIVIVWAAAIFGLLIAAAFSASKCGDCSGIRKSMKTVYICSPLAGDIQGNIKNAKCYCRMAIQQNMIPIAPHVFFTEYLDDTIPEQRAAGRAMGIDLLNCCDELWVCGFHISEGMKTEIRKAFDLGIPVRSVFIEINTKKISQEDDENELEK